MKFRTLMLAALLSLVPGFASASGGRAELKWTSWDQGLKTAAASKRPMLVDVYTDWCGWCRRMDHDVYSRDDVREYLSRHFVAVRLDAESPSAVSYDSRRYTESSLAARFRVSGYPTTIFLKCDGTHLVNVPGYVPAEKFMKLVRYIGDGHMERGESWEEYSRPAPAN